MLNPFRFIPKSPSRLLSKRAAALPPPAHLQPRFVAPPHPATLDPDVLLQSCELHKGRESGPGGQHRNKVETKVTLIHVPTAIQAHAGERRSAEQNRRVALSRLRLELATLVRCTPQPRDSWGDVRSDLWRRRTQGRRIICSPTHADYPALLSEALDVLEASQHDPKAAALRLCISPSQLVRFIKDYPPALARWNQLRALRGEHALK